MRQFLEKVARNILGFDPHVATNWYTVSSAHLVKTIKVLLITYINYICLILFFTRKNIYNFINFQGMQSVLGYFKGSLSKALIHLFPEMKIDQTQMLKSPSKLIKQQYKTKNNQFINFNNPDKYWKNISNRRALLDKFASTKGLNSLLPETWYNLSKKDVLSTTVSFFYYT